MKITVVGAGAVGATTADNLVRRNVAEEIILLDIKEGFAEGKAQDMMQTSALLGFDSTIKGVTNDYLATAGSTVAVITSGIPRKPGMTREELIGTNANIVKSVVENLIKHSPDIIILIVSNPMDTMTYLALKSSGLPKNRIIGMGGALDSARFKYQISDKLNASANDLNAIVIGGHGDTTMIPLIKHATWNSVPVSDFLTEEEEQEIVKKTMVGGATLTALIGTSAWYAPGAAAAAMVESIVRDQNRLFTASVYLEGEYGQEDINVGVPVIINAKGWDRIVPMNLSSEEEELFKASADAVRKMNDVLFDEGVLKK
ncbi:MULTISPECIES: malate dehydrogenase [Sphingobacterium]|jgi:malate dehydrogenase|uniref:malate dehydrogenase n=1 Tax=Sphingobacterium TaxID=28453 RepID=UPI000C0BEF98|nr:MULTISPECIES: malate dehydrogenase [Sphingobacterium]MCT1532787.1 malate dehydrogenase [Sphingobacterium daejeonense]